MISYIKYLVKKYFYFFILRDKYSASVQIGLYALGIELRKAPYRFAEIEFNVFTYQGEDGLLFNLFSHIEKVPNTFVDIGSGNCVKSNCANLALNLGWNGVFIDADKRNIAIGKSFYHKLSLTKFNPPVFMNTAVTPNNVNELIKQANISGKIGLLSIDIDGDDYWIWKAIDTINPIAVIVESKVEFASKELVTPCSGTTNNYNHSGNRGASIPALCKLAKEKGYTLVSANRPGYNLIFLSNEYLQSSSIKELKQEDVLNFPQVKSCFLSEDELKNLEFVKG